MKTAYLKPIVVKSFSHGLKQTRPGSFKGQSCFHLSGFIQCFIIYFFLTVDLLKPNLLATMQAKNFMFFEN